MDKIGFSLQNSYCMPMENILHLLRDIGFYAVSPTWQREHDLDSLINTAVQCGLSIQSLHGPLRGIPNLWSKDPSRFAPLLQDFLDTADACACYGIPLMVVHSWSGLDYTSPEPELYFGNFDLLVAHAAEKGIQVAFENLEGPQYLDALMAHYAETSHVGFCWDSGHERCYTPHRNFLPNYGNRLIMTHLNDNLGVTTPDGRLCGTDDLHLLPGDGKLDWNTAIKNLRQARKQDILNFELKIRPKGDRCTLDLYSKLPLEAYFTDAYRRAHQIASAYFAP